MPSNKQGGMRKKKRVHMVKESPFPIPMSTSSGEPPSSWFYYTGYIEGSAVVIKHSGDMDYLYKMGFFGKGTLSRSQPNFRERRQKVHIEVPQKDGQQKDIQAVVVNKRSYLVHRRYRALADGRTKEYNDVVHHEEQQQGFVDSTDENDNNSGDDSSSSDNIESGKMVAFKLLNTSDCANEASLASGLFADGSKLISEKIRADLVSILNEVSLLSNEQITTFLQVPQDMKLLAEKFKKMRAAEIKSLKQMYSAQFPSRHFKQGEVINLDDDSAVSENEVDNAVVISDSDDAGGNTEEKMECDNSDARLFSQEKYTEGKTRNNKIVNVKSCKTSLADWESDDSNFWTNEVADGADKGKTVLGESGDKVVEETVVGDIGSGKKEEKTSSGGDMKEILLEESENKVVEETVFGGKGSEKKENATDSGESQELFISNVESVVDKTSDENETLFEDNQELFISKIESVIDKPSEENKTVSEDNQEMSISKVESAVDKTSAENETVSEDNQEISISKVESAVDKTSAENETVSEDNQELSISKVESAVDKTEENETVSEDNQELSISKVESVVDKTSKEDETVSEDNQKLSIPKVESVVDKTSEENEPVSEDNQEMSISKVESVVDKTSEENVDELKMNDRMETDVHISASTQAVENEKSVKTNHQDFSNENGDAERDKPNLLSIDNKYINIPDLKIMENIVECKASADDGSCDSKVDVKDEDDIKSSNEEPQSSSQDICSMDTSQDVKSDGETLRIASSISRESSQNSPDISSGINVPKTIIDTVTNNSEIVELPKHATDVSQETESSKHPSIDSKSSNSTCSTSKSDVINLDEDKQVSFENDNSQSLMKYEKMQKDNIFNLDSYKQPDDTNYSDVSSLNIAKNVENVMPANITVISVENDSILSNADDGVTNVDSGNSNDSDDVICIESKSAEPNKLHNFLSQSTKQPFPVVTKSVTFMSSITEMPTFVCASVGFQSWGPVLHFNFTGDASHLPTVMSVSSSSLPDAEKPSRSEQHQNSNTIYERIYPPIRSLVPHANSTGAVIKQRLRGLPCLSSAYVKVSQSHGNRYTSSRNGTTHMKNSQVPISRLALSQFTFSSNIQRQQQQHITPSSAQKNLQPCSSEKPPPPTENASSSSKLTISFISSYMKAFHTEDKYNISDSMNDDDIKILQEDTDNNKPYSISPLSAIVSKLEKLYKSAFTKEKSDICSSEMNNLLSEFHVILNNYLSSVEISTTREFNILNLLLSKDEHHSNIFDEDSQEAKNNLSDFQKWLLEKRFEHCEKIQKRDSNQVVNVGLTVDLDNKTNTSQSQPDVNSEMIIEEDLIQASVDKQNSLDTHKANNLEKLNTPDAHIKNCEVTLNEDKTESKQIFSNKTLKHNQRALQTENRKRKFDRSDENSEEKVKISKLNDDEVFMLDKEIKVNSCNSHTDEDMLIDGELSDHLDKEPKNHVNDKSSANSLETVASDNLKESFVIEKLNDATNSNCVQKHSQTSGNSRSFQSENDVNKDHDDVTMSVKDLEDIKSSLGGDLTLMEVEDSKMVESSTTHTSSHVQPQQSFKDGDISQQLTDNEFMKDNGIVSPLFRNKLNSHSSKPEGENAEGIYKISASEQEQHRDSASAECLPSESITSIASPKEKQNEKLLEKTDDSSGNLLEKGEINQAEVTPNSRDITTHLGLCKDIGSNNSTVSSTCNTQSNMSQSVAGKDSLQNAGASEEFQICIGSSSDEDEELQEKTQIQPTLDGVHPYSSRDDNGGDLFVIPNTSDEDYDDNYDENEERGNRKKPLVWHPCVKKDPYPTEERLHLMLEEAFFLSYGLGCLQILDPEMKMLNLTQMWQQFSVLKEKFIPHYVAYHYFRSKGWVPKSGLKFGCDLILYREGPPFYHGSYSVVVTVVKDTTLLPVHKNGGMNFNQRKLNWISLAGLNRITEHVAKELMMCYVIWPGDLTHEESLSPDCLSRFKVKEVIVSRWVSSQERENKVGEEEEIP